MSMNSSELNFILDELELEGSSLQNIFQPNFQTLLLELYKEGKVRTLLISLDPQATRLHETRFKFSQKGIAQRFVQYLRANLKNGRIISATQYGLERIIILEIETESTSYKLYLRLWGNAGNLVVCNNETGLIEDCMFRRPSKNEISSGIFTLPELRTATKTFSVRDFPQTSSLSQALDEFYTGGEKSREKEKLSQDLLALLGRQEAKLENLAAQARDFIQKSESFEQYKYFGDIITSSIYAIKPGQKMLVTADWYDVEKTLSIPLNSAKSAQENAAAWYQKYQKARDGIEHKKQTLEAAETQLRKLAEFQNLVKSAEETHVLRELQEKISALYAPSTKAIEEEKILGARFFCRGFLLIIGRSAKENDQLLRHSVRGNDIWLHARDVPGSYVFIKTIKGKTIPLDVLLDAAHLAVWYSKSRNASAADVYYTHVKYLRRAKDGPLGLVIPTQEKNLIVKIDQQRLSKLLEQD